MLSKKLFQILVQSIITLVVFASVTQAETVAFSPAMQPVATNALTDSSSETQESEGSGEVHIARPADKWRLDLRAKKKTEMETKAVASAIASKDRFAPLPKFAVVNKAFDSSNVLETESTEAQEQQAPKPAAPSNGTNPAELITRVEVKYQYQNFASGDLHGIAVIRGDYAITPKVAFRMDLPILRFDSKTPGLRSESGIGDVVTSMTFVKMFSRRFVGAVVPRIDFPTATHDSLGSGKYAFKPAVVGITPLAKGVALAGVLEYRVSFAGNKNRADINELSLKPILLKSFLEGPLKGYYVNPQAEVIVDFEHDNRATLQLAANMGKLLNKNVVVFVVPTIHVAGTKRESFKLEVGFRYLFR